MSITAINAQSLPLDDETQKVTYTETITIDTLSKAVLYERAKEWIITKSEDNKPSLADSSKGDLKAEISFVIKLTYDYKYKKDSKVTFDATINIKDGKYRYIFNNFRIYDVKSGLKTETSLESYYSKLRHSDKIEFVNQVQEQVNALTADLKQLMEKGKLVKKDDW